MKKVLNRTAVNKSPLMKLMSALSILTFGIYISVTTLHPSIDVCSQNDVVENISHNNMSLSSTCQAKGNEVSWIAWITNKSSSNQFHFLDLLELLSQFTSDNKK
ncbi:MAG: hypothetical protein ACI9O6_000362 [Glaciecola sp.]|jgi:hypothetical protein